MSDDVYIHGTDPAEQRRLRLMNELINPPCLRELDLGKGDHVLEVGAGVGDFARAMAAAVAPGGRVVGVERDPTQLRAGQERHGHVAARELRHGDATALPLDADEARSFDVAHARFLLEHVPDPSAVVAEMVRAVRPGGQVVLADDDHEAMRVWPEAPGFVELWSRYIRLQDRLGHDPLVGRRLVSLLRRAGAVPSRCTLVFYGGCAGSPRFADYVENLVGVLDGIRDRLLAHDLYDARSFARVVDSVREWAQRDDATLWYSISWAEGRVPDSLPASSDG